MLAVPYSPVTGIPGWESESEEKKLISLAGELSAPAMIVELGGEYGRSAGAFLYGLWAQDKAGEVWTVDLFPMSHPEVGDLYAFYRANIDNLLKGLPGHKLRNSVIKGDAAQMVNDWKIESPSRAKIDLLFIDTGHTYTETLAQLAAWEPLLAPNGIIAFHDYAKHPGAHPLHWEVKQAVDEWFNPSVYTWHDAPDSLVFVRKIEKVVKRRATRPKTAQMNGQDSQDEAFGS